MLSVWRPREFRFSSASNPALNPSRSAAIHVDDRPVGWLGELHPRLQSEFELRYPVVIFALDHGAIGPAELPRIRPQSRFPSVRRDLAVVVDENLTAGDLTKLVSAALGDRLRNHEIFDLYRGSGVEAGRKSIGIGLILQDASRTLTDQETDDMMRELMRRLERQFGARIRT